MKVFRLNDCDWWAAETLEEAIADAVDTTGISREDLLEDPRELTDYELDTLRFLDDSDVVNVSRSFREELDYMLAHGYHFPAFFASTEY